jgi:hypothetical protein
MIHDNASLLRATNKFDHSDSTNVKIATII